MAAPHRLGSVTFPSTRLMFCTVSRGWSYVSQCALLKGISQAFKYRMRVLPPPLSVTLPPPSITVSPSLSAPPTLLMRICCVSVIVTGAAPQLKVMTPAPSGRRRRARAAVQLAAVPVPTTVVGVDTSAAWPSAGTTQLARRS